MIDEKDFEARALQQFLDGWRRWRAESPEKYEVMVYVGSPEQLHKMLGKLPLVARTRENILSEAVHDQMAREPKFQPRLVQPGVVQCDCAACTASRATREESKAYDA